MNKKFMRQLDAILRDPFARALCAQVSVWQAEFGEMEDRREKLEAKLDAGYKLAGALADDYGMELVSRFEEVAKRARS